MKSLRKRMEILRELMKSLKKSMQFLRNLMETRRNLMKSIGSLMKTLRNLRNVLMCSCLSLEIFPHLLFSHGTPYLSIEIFGFPQVFLKILAEIIKIHWKMLWSSLGVFAYFVGPRMFFESVQFWRKCARASTWSQILYVDLLCNEVVQHS